MHWRPLGGILAYVLCARAPALSAPADLREAERAIHVMRLTIGFEENRGQLPGGVRFVSRGATRSLVLTEREAVVVGDGDAFRLRFGQPGRLAAEERLPGEIRSYVGNDPRLWTSGIRRFERVRFERVARGVDAVLHARADALELDWVLAPGADPRRLRLEVDGARRLSIESNGDLLLDGAHGNLRLKRPIARQKGREVASRLVLLGPRTVGVALGAYDAGAELVVDPVLVYSTAVGGTQVDIARGVVVDSAGAAYVVGRTNSPDFPVTAGAIGPTNKAPTGKYSAFVAKLSPSGGELVWATYLGGTAGNDIARAVALAPNGDVLLGGGTFSSDFPTTAGVAQPTFAGGSDLYDVAAGDAFIVRLGSDGHLVWSTYLGGSEGDVVGAVAVDPAGNAYVMGASKSLNFPVTPGAFRTFPTAFSATHDFVAKLSPTGTLVYSTFLGGSNIDFALFGIAADAAGNAYVTGYSGSTDLPTTAGAFQRTPPVAQDISPFVAKIAPSGGALVWMTYLTGSSSGDVPLGLAIDAAGAVYVTGLAHSTDFPTTPGAFQRTKRGGFGDAFVSKIAPNGSSLVWSTYLGGSDGESTNFDYSAGIAVEPSGAVWVSHLTYSPDFPVTADAFQPLVGGSGIYKSTDGGASFARSAAGIPTGSMVSVVVDPSRPGTVIAAGTGGVFTSHDSGATWANATTGIVRTNGRRLVQDPTSPQTLYVITGGDTGLEVSGTTKNGGIQRSTDGGATFGAPGPGIQPSFNVISIYALAIDPTQTTRLYAGATTGLYRSINSGGSWSPTSITGFVRQVAMAGANILIQSGQPAAVMRSTNGGASFQEVAGLPSNGIQFLLANPHNPTSVFASGTAGIYRSTDGGATFAPSVTPLPDGYYDTLALDPTNGDTLYAGVSDNIYKSTDGGATWALSQGVTPGGVNEFAIDPLHPTDVYVASNIYGDAFVTKIDPTGSSLLFSSFLGGGRTEFPYALALDGSNNVYVVGSSSSADFPRSKLGPGLLAASGDAFVAKLGAGPALSLTPAAQDFGSVAVGATADRTFTVTNNGSGTLTGTVSASGPFSVTSGASFSLGAGATQSITVRFSPAAVGAATGTLALASNGGAATAALTGTGAAPAGTPAISIAPTSLDFGNALISSFVDLALIVSNTGGGVLTGTVTAAPPFYVAAGGTLNVLAGQSQAVTFRFQPTAAGPASATATFASNAGTGTAALTGRGVAPDPAYAWHSIGPYESPGAAVVVDPQNPSTLYAVNAVTSYTPFGNVFKSTNAGASWFFSGGGLLETTRVWAIALAPSSPSTLYVGTQSGAVFRSTDGAATWVRTAYVAADYLAVDPTNPAIAYAAGRQGVFKSTDSGVTWAKKGGAPASASAVAVDPKNASVVCVLTPKTTPAAGFYKSTDAGETWTSMSAGLPVASEDFHVIVFDPVTTSTIYAASGAGFSSSGHLYKTTSGGTSWATTGLVPISVYSVVVDPKSPSVVYASGYTTAGVYKSVNGGASFTRMTAGFPDETNVPTLAIDPSTTSTLYAGVQVSFMGLHEGVYKSTDAGASWAFSNAGLAGLRVDDVAGDPVNGSVVYAAVDNARAAKSTDGGASWSLVRVADVANATTVAVDPKNPSVVYLGTTFSHVFKSTDGGATFPTSATLPGGVLRIAIDPKTTSTIWVTTNTGVDRSTDGGTTFAPASTGVALPNAFIATGPIVIDPTATSTLYVAYRGTGVFKTTNGGTAWTAMNAGLPDLNALGLALDPTSPSTLYVGVTGGVFKSTDGGASWGARLPASPASVTTLAVDPQNPAVLYAGSDAPGVYRSVNRGASWAPFSLGLTELNVLAFGFTRTTPSTVFAGTQYGSVFAAQPPVALGPALSAVNPSSGPTGGGTRVTLTGTNLSADALVTFGGTAAGNVTSSGPTSLAVTTNAHAAGAVDVVVTNPDGQFATLAGGFTYVAGPGLAVSPSSLDFGTVPVGGTKDLTLTISNTGVGTLTGTATATAPFSVASGGSFSLDTGGTQTVTIRFSPSGAGATTGSVSFTSNGGGASVTLSGSAIEQGGSVFIPIVLSVAGLKGAFFTSELTLTNRGTIGTNVVLTYTATFGGGSGGATIYIGPGEQKIFKDAIEFLRTNGTPLPTSGNRGGTLRVRFVSLSAPGAGAATVRTTTAVTEGRAGLAYPGLAPERLLTGTAYVCGLRQSATDRSNLAVMNAGAEQDGSVVLRLQVFSGVAGASTATTLPDIPLAPGGFAQVTEILASNGLSLSNGYVRIERISGTAPWFAYGVINDQVNSDGSFVPPVPVAALVGRTGETLPVIVEAGTFSTELVVTNFGTEPRTLDLVFVADAVSTADHSTTFSLTLAAGEQQILPDIIQLFRDRGVPGIGPKGPAFAGALFVTVRSHDASGVVVAARTSAPGGGGRYGTFYTAVPYGAAANDTVWLYGLQQNGENRSNLALVNTGEVDGSGDAYRLEVYDGATGALVKTLDGVSLPPRRFRQFTAFLADNAPGTGQAYVKVTRVAGTNPFFAYVVINDGAKPGDRSGDGAFSPGSFDAGPLLALSPTTLDFGTVVAGHPKDLTVSVRNAGGGTLTGSASIAAPSAFSVASGGAFSLDAGQAQDITLRFAPTVSGTLVAELHVATNGGDGTVLLGGTGSAPAISVTPASLDFGAVAVGATKDLALTVSNGGTAPLTVGALSTSAPFAVVSPAVPFMVAAGGGQQVTVRFAPSTAGSASGTLSIASDDLLHPNVTVALAGSGAGATATEELSTDDGSLETGILGDGLLVVNRLTPSRYPATLQKIRIFVTRYAGQPNPAGVTITAVVFTDPAGGGSPPASHANLVAKTMTLPTIPEPAGLVVDVDVPGVAPLASGDLYVGFQAPNPAGGFAFGGDTNGPQKNRAFFSTNGGATYTALGVSSGGTVIPVNVLIHAVVAE
jgi:photosystem II stability/assembly factor-like uncharacterized protein